MIVISSACTHRSDPFSEDILPHTEPQLMSGPQPDDFVDETRSFFNYIP